MNISITVISSLIIFIFPYIGKRWFNRTILANTVVTLGVLGTFSGIFFGLIYFDVDHIENALPQLLEGLKTAFLTSIAGMCSSLILKLFPVFYGVKPEENEKNDEAETQRLLTTLSLIETNTAETTQAVSNHMTMLNQSFINFAQHVSQLNIEALTAALQTVMTQWDTKVSGQLDTTLQEINMILQNLHKTEQSNTEQIQVIYKSLEKAVEVLNQTSDNLKLSMNKSMHISTQQHETVTGQMDQLGNLMKNTEEHWEKQINKMEERFKRELSAMEQFSKTLITIIKKLTQDHNTINRRQEEEN